MQNILQTVFQHLIFAKGLKRWPNMLNIMQHRNLLLSVHNVDGDGWSWWWWWWSWGWWRWHAEDLEYYATREPALSVHLPGTPEAPVSHRFKRWSGPSLTSWSTKSTLESVNISKYSKGMVNGHLSNQLHHFSIVVIFADMWTSLTSFPLCAPSFAAMEDSFSSCWWHHHMNCRDDLFAEEFRGFTLSKV